MMIWPVEMELPTSSAKSDRMSIPLYPPGKCFDKEVVLSSKKREPSQPPQPPSVTRKFQFHLIQLIGMPLIILVPVLAMLGVFGETLDSVMVSNPQLEMHVEYPARFRYKMIDSVRVSLLNISTRLIPTVRVEFDQAYVEEFSTVTFTPSVKHITDSVYMVEITDLEPGETRVISVTIQAEKNGRHEGTITATPENSAGLQVSIVTVTFP
jgi:hypothetical protein